MCLEKCIINYLTLRSQSANECLYHNFPSYVTCSTKNKIYTHHMIYLIVCTLCTLCSTVLNAHKHCHHVLPCVKSWIKFVWWLRERNDGVCLCLDINFFVFDIPHTVAPSRDTIANIDYELTPNHHVILFTFYNTPIGYPLYFYIPNQTIELT